MENRYDGCITMVIQENMELKGRVKELEEQLEREKKEKCKLAYKEEQYNKDIKKLKSLYMFEIYKNMLEKSAEFDVLAVLTGTTPEELDKNKVAAIYGIIKVNMECNKDSIVIQEAERLNGILDKLYKTNKSLLDDAYKKVKEISKSNT